MPKKTLLTKKAKMKKANKKLNPENMPKATHKRIKHG